MKGKVFFFLGGGGGGWKDLDSVCVPVIFSAERPQAAPVYDMCLFLTEILKMNKAYNHKKRICRANHPLSYFLLTQNIW